MMTHLIKGKGSSDFIQQLIHPLNLTVALDGKIRGSSKSVGFIFWEIMTVQNYEPNVETLHQKSKNSDLLVALEEKSGDFQRH